MSEAKKRNDELVWRLVEAPDIGGLLLAAVLRLVSGTPLQLLFAGLGDKGNVRYFGIEIDDAVEIAEKIDIYSTDAILQQPDTVGGNKSTANFLECDVRSWDVSTLTDTRQTRNFCGNAGADWCLAMRSVGPEDIRELANCTHWRFLSLTCGSTIHLRSANAHARGCIVR